MYVTAIPAPPTPLLADAIGTLVLLFAVATALYFAPAIVAYRRRKVSRAAILVFNFFLGWTFLGWVVALIWALKVDSVDLLAAQHAIGQSR